MPATWNIHAESTLVPYSRHSIDEADIEAVVRVLRSDWLTTGPLVSRFEQHFAESVGCEQAVAVSSGTAALHAMMHGLNIQPGDEVIVPAMTFAATANCVLYAGGTPVIVDVDPGSLLIDPDAVQQHLSAKTRAIIAVDFAGQPCEYDRLQALADPHGVAVVADACHSLGATDRGQCVGALARMSAFSFHPVKPITCAEGGMVATNESALASRLRSFRNHGIAQDHRQRQELRTWAYEMRELGFNYRLSDVQCALGLSQLKRLDQMVARRQQIAARYAEALNPLPAIQPLTIRPGVTHAYHLYVVRWRAEQSVFSRREAFHHLREAGLGVNVHYLPVHLHPYYQERLGTRRGMCPVAESAYQQLLSLPIYPGMSDDDVQRVIETVRELATVSRRRAG